MHRYNIVQSNTTDYVAEPLANSKCYIFVQGKKTINALSSLKTATPTSLLDEPGGESPTGRRAEFVSAHNNDGRHSSSSSSSSSSALQRGQVFFDRTYGKVAKQVMHQMDHSGTEDLGVVARMYYSYVFSNTSVLSAVETSYVLIAALIPQDVSLFCYG